MNSGDSCLVLPTGKGNKRRTAVVLESCDKSCKVKFDDDDSEERVSCTKLRPLGRPKAAPPPAESPAEPIRWRTGPLPPAGSDGQPAKAGPQPKPEPPARSEAYKAFIRRQPCCNCARDGLVSEGLSDPDHEGPRGVGQKTSDFLTIPLCRPCHRIITDTYCLPAAYSRLWAKPILETRAWTEVFIQMTQAELLQRVLSSLELGDRLKALEVAVRTLDSKVLAAALIDMTGADSEQKK